MSEATVAGLGAKQNNFDLIRAVAALQVLVWHGVDHIHLPLPSGIVWFLGSFPGVPIFFVISGYLISASWQRSRNLSEYFLKRAIRIFPGLWACFFLTALSILAVQGFFGASFVQVLPWIAANLAGFAYTPMFLKGYGTGAVNGSLWTIPVELQFYTLLPFLMMFLANRRIRWIAVFVVALGLGLLYGFVLRGQAAGVWGAALGRLVLPWLYMFLLGVILQSRIELIKGWLQGRFVYWLLAYILWISILDAIGLQTVGNVANPLALIPLAGVVVSGAMTCPGLAHRLLNGNDISYGIYLYHMPVINVAVALGVGWGAGPVFLVVALATLTLAVGSWQFVERPALRRKSLFAANRAVAKGVAP